MTDADLIAMYAAAVEDAFDQLTEVQEQITAGTLSTSDDLANLLYGLTRRLEDVILTAPSREPAIHEGE